MNLTKEVVKLVEEKLKGEIDLLNLVEEISDQQVVLVLHNVMNDPELKDLIEDDELEQLITHTMAEMLSGEEDVLEDIEEEVLSNVQMLEQAVIDYRNTKEEKYFEILYNHYHQKLVGLAYRNYDEDLSQELLMVLLDAIDNFDETKGFRFNTFFWSCAKKFIGCKKIKSRAQKRNGNTVSFNAAFDYGDGETTLEDYLGDKNIDNDFDNIIAKLDIEAMKPLLKEDERTAVEMIVNGHIYSDIAEKLEMTTPGVHVKLRRLANKPHVKRFFT